MSEDEALIQLLRLLASLDYRFTSVTPATHARVLARRCGRPGLRDIFGWSRPFTRSDLPPDLFDLLASAGMLDTNADELRSRVRVAALGDKLFLHSAYPTLASDAVFFGPDTYRFVRFVRDRLAALPQAPHGMVDMGTGSGAGAISAALQCPAARVVAVDCNPQALRFARVNAAAAGADVETLLGSEMPCGADLVIANPPYIMDAGGRAYRDGGELLGGGVALDWTAQALRKLAPGGTMLLYTGASVTEGRVPLLEALERACTQAGAEIVIEETDPDVFGEELEQPAYANVERIALICATVRKP